MNVIHEPDRNRFVAYLPGGEAELLYLDRGSRVLDFASTYTPPAERGNGVAAQVVEVAVRYARENDYRIVPTCWFVRDWLAAHPDEAALVKA